MDIENKKMLYIFLIISVGIILVYNTKYPQIIASIYTFSPLFLIYLYYCINKKDYEGEYHAITLSIMTIFAFGCTGFAFIGAISGIILRNIKAKNIKKDEISIN